LPLDAVELTSYYFAETSAAYLDKLKAYAAPDAKREGYGLGSQSAGSGRCRGSA
jgi:hypothetical protein